MSEDDPTADESYVAEEGDCISSLAEAHGLKWQTLWNHNPELKTLRKNPNALQPGDVILIPSQRLRYESRPTDQLHKFVRKGVPAKFRLILERFDEPLANKRWVLSVDGQVHSGTTDSKGYLEIALPPEASSGHLVVPEEDLDYDLSLEMDDNTRDAILMFQTAHGLPATGKLDDRTRTELEQRHDLTHSQPAAESNAPPAETPGEADKLEEVTFDDEEDDNRFRQFEQLDEEEE